MRHERKPGPRSPPQGLARTPTVLSHICHLSKALQNTGSLFRVFHSLPAVEVLIRALSDDTTSHGSRCRRCLLGDVALAVSLRQWNISGHSEQRLRVCWHDSAHLLALLGSALRRSLSRQPQPLQSGSQNKDIQSKLASDLARTAAWPGLASPGQLRL